MGSIGTQELILIFIVVLLIFGGKKLPELARGLGQGIREFKKATSEVQNEVNRSLEDIENNASTADKSTKDVHHAA